MSKDIERVAAAIFAEWIGPAVADVTNAQRWDVQPEYLKDTFRRMARAALMTALEQAA